jgi:hypothetical protein
VRKGAQGAKDRRGPGAAITLQALLEEEEAGMVQLGDASIASPFTARSTTIGPGTPLVRVLRRLCVCVCGRACGG